MFKRICPLFLLTLSINLHAVEFAVSPMLININAQPGEVKDFEIAVSGKESGNVTISLFTMQQMDSGHMSFIEQQALSGAGTQAISWIDFEKVDYRISRNETTQIRGKVSVPRKAKGTFLAAIMVEEILSRSTSNVSVKVRYAVILNIHVEGRNGRVKTAFDDLVVVNRDGLALIEGSFSNSNAFMGFLDSSVQVRDQNRRLIARLPLRTESAWQRGDKKSRVYPGATVKVFAPLKRELVAGDYSLMVRNQFGGRTQPIYRKEITYRPIASDAPENKTASKMSAQQPRIEIIPAEIEVAPRSSGVSLSTLAIVNHSEQSMELEFTQNLVDSSLKSYQFIPAKVKLKPKQKRRVILKQIHVRGVSYKGLAFKATVRDDSGFQQVLAINTRPSNSSGDKQ